MALSKVWGIGKTVRNATKFSKLIFLFIPLFGFLSVTMGVVSFYGQYTGDMSVAIDQFSDSSIRISEDPTFAESRTVLRYPGMSFVNQASYEGVMAFHYQNVIQTPGYYLPDVKDKDREVIAFTFYLKNMNEAATINRINYKILFLETSKHIEEHLRIMVVVDNVADVYEYQSYRIPGVQSLSFASRQVAVDGNIFQLKAQNTVKISVILWIDGYLEDYLKSIGKYTEEDLMGGRLKLQMIFSVNEEGS
ncbi:MAG TPA: hypothetical protein VK005_01580 [Acholeplasma sp.]|nr:hypothetical protein [Acholeplasma sp.]